MSKVLFFVVLCLAGYGVYVYVTRRPGDEGGDPPPLLPPLPPVPRPPRPVPPARVEELISGYLNSLEKDIGAFELSSYYSYQFDLAEYKRPYTRQVATISSLTDLGLAPEELKAGNELLTAKASQVTKGRSLDWGSSLRFLMDYAAIKGKLSALKKVYDKVGDKAAADEQIHKLQRAMDELVARYG
jgi:hypothetical protein